MNLCIINQNKQNFGTLLVNVELYYVIQLWSTNIEIYIAVDNKHLYRQNDQQVIFEAMAKLKDMDLQRQIKMKYVW